ncbi:MAG: class I SAM-dependent methyltransferase [Alphaproteobacteria bacterium]|nr:class I SAM-dependent methyltransferase [Alphaproteobacteria bacterium]
MRPHTRDFYDAPELYDLEYFDSMIEDRAWYADLARGHDRVLELACGTGRLTLPMARTGAAIAAVDRAPAMLAALQRRLVDTPSLQVEVYQQDFLTLDVPGTFPLAVLPFNALQHVHRTEDVVRLLERVAAHLEPGGRFAFDVVIPDPRFWARDPNGVHEVRWYDDPRGGRMKTWENGFYDPIRQINTVRYHYRRSDRSYEVIEIAMRMFYPQELMGLVGMAGWAIEGAWGDFDRGPLKGRSGKLVMVLRRP